MAFADGQSGGMVRNPTGVMDLLLTGTVSIGDAVDKDGARALATAGTATQIACVALANGVSGETIPVAFESAIVGGRFSGGTAGAAIYVAEGTSNGMYTETAPTTTDDVNTIVGYMISATEAIVLPNQRAKSVAT